MQSQDVGTSTFPHVECMRLAQTLACFRRPGAKSLVACMLSTARQHLAPGTSETLSLVTKKNDLLSLLPGPRRAQVMRIQPDEAIYLKVNNKVPGLGLNLDVTKLDLTYKQRYNTHLPDAYERLILDVVNGDKRLFIRNDELDAAWALFTPILKVLLTCPFCNPTKVAIALQHAPARRLRAPHPGRRQRRQAPLHPQRRARRRLGTLHAHPQGAVFVTPLQPCDPACLTRNDELKAYRALFALIPEVFFCTWGYHLCTPDCACAPLFLCSFLRVAFLG